MATTHKARHLPRDPGVSGWDAILPNAPPRPRLSDNITCDLLVIGAGFAGLSAARRHTQLDGGGRVVVIDATRVAHGPAGRNSGFMMDLPHDLTSSQYTASIDRDRAQIKLNRHAIAFAKKAAEEFNLPNDSATATGRINGAVDDNGAKHNRDYIKHLENLDEPYEELDKQNMKAITGSDFYATGLYMPGSVLIQPAQYIRGLADGISDKNRKNPVAIYENTPALMITRYGNDWQVKTPQGTITTPKIILAVNGHAENFGFFKGRLMHVFTYASMTTAMSDEQVKKMGGQPRWGVTPSDPMGSTVRRISGGSGGTRIVVRNRWSYDPSMEVSDARIARYGRSHDKGLLRRFPTFGGLKMEYRWGGRLCLSYNSVAAFGEVDDGIIAACCQNGLGTAKGTLAGIAAAEMAALSTTPLVEALLSENPPQKLPPTPLAWLGATAVIKWREFKGRNEI